MEPRDLGTRDEIQHDEGSLRVADGQHIGPRAVRSDGDGPRFAAGHDDGVANQRIRRHVDGDHAYGTRDVDAIAARRGGHGIGADRRQRNRRHTGVSGDIDDIELVQSVGEHVRFPSIGRHRNRPHDERKGQRRADDGARRRIQELQAVVGAAVRQAKEGGRRHLSVRAHGRSEDEAAKDQEAAQCLDSCVHGHPDLNGKPHRMPRQGPRRGPRLRSGKHDRRWWWRDDRRSHARRIAGEWVRVERRAGLRQAEVPAAGNRRHSRQHRHV